MFNMAGRQIPGFHPAEAHVAPLATTVPAPPRPGMIQPAHLAHGAAPTTIPNHMQQFNNNPSPYQGDRLTMLRQHLLASALRGGLTGNHPQAPAGAMGPAAPHLPSIR